MRDTKKEEMSSSAERLDNTDSNYEMVKRQRVEGSPFELITIEDEGSFIALGNKRLTEVYEKKLQALDAINEKSWNNIIRVMVVVMDNINNK